MFDWFEQNVMMAAFDIGKSGVEVANKSAFTAHREQIEIIALWCHGERFENTKTNKDKPREIERACQGAPLASKTDMFVHWRS